MPAKHYFVPNVRNRNVLRVSGKRGLPFSTVTQCLWWQIPTHSSPVVPPHAQYPNVPRIFDVATAGLYSFDGSGSLTTLKDQNAAGTVTLATTSRAACSVSANGRVVVTAGGSTVAVLYLVGAGEEFIFSVDNRNGFFQPQTSEPFIDSSTDGNYFFGALQPPWGFGGSSGVASLKSGTIALTTDAYQKGVLTYGQMFEETYMVSANGRATTGSGNEVIYAISPTKFLMLDVNPADGFPNIEEPEQ